MNQRNELSHPDQMEIAQQLPADLMLVKMEGEHIMTMATQRRQPIATVIKEACELLEAFPQAAHQAIYSKPVGLKADRCTKCGHEVQRKSWQKFSPRCEKCPGNNANLREGKMQYATGLSIRAMESLSSLVGYNRLAATETQVGDGLYKVTAIFTDYGRGIIRSDESLVSQWKKGRGGSLYKEDDARFIEMTLKAAKSKVKRNAIRDAMPFELRQAYEETAAKVAPKFLTPEKIKAIVAAFEQQGILLADLNSLLQREKSDKWTAADNETLRGVWTALEAGEMTVDELLAECRRPVDAGSETDDGKSAEPKSTGSRGKPAGGNSVLEELTGTAEPSNESPADDPEPEARPARTRRPATPPAEKPPQAAAAAAPRQTQPTTTATAKPPAQANGGNGPAKPAGAAASPRPAGSLPTTARPASAGPVGSETESAPSSITREECTQYMQDFYPDDVESFNVRSIALRAVGQANPKNFIDLILQRKNPHWANFLLPTTEEPEETTNSSEAEPVTEDEPESDAEFSQESPADEVDIPESVTNPLPRPTLGLVAEAVEKQMNGYKQTKRIQDLIDKQVKISTALTNEESAYLIDLGTRRIWELDHPQS